jgi:Ca-activated chloride channel family protein
MMRLAMIWWLAIAGAGLMAGLLWWLRRHWQRFPFPGRVRSAGRQRLAAATTVVAGFLAATAFVPLAVALARPQEVLSHRLEHSLGVDIVIALDVSGSMAALDFEPSDRLGVAKEVISRFLDRRREDRFALVIFAGAAVTLCPLTLDHEVAQHLLDQVRLRTLPDGTAIGLGLGTAVTRLRASDADSKVIILVTDGANNTGMLDPETASDLAVEQGITVHTVLVGSSGEVPVPVQVRDPASGKLRTEIRRYKVDINPELLAEISRKTGGTSFRARDPEALERVFENIDAMEKTEFTSTSLVRYQERFEPWAWISLVLVLAAVLVEGVAGATPW